MPTDILIFDVELGQSIFVYPHSAPEYGMLVDCGNTRDFEPIDFLVQNGYVTNNSLTDLTLTNYDQDHFSGLPYLRRKVNVRSVLFANNLSSEQLRAVKAQPHTEALKHTCQVKDTYTETATWYQPPFTKQVFSLSLSDCSAFDQSCLTNNLSQVVFIQHNGSVICIAGDLEEAGWKLLLHRQPLIKDWLRATNVFVASHHGRANGYCPDLFCDCALDCVIISDKGIMHDTQRNAAALYGNHIRSGVVLNGCSRKVLTTRDDGHIRVRFAPGGARSYDTFSHA